MKVWLWLAIAFFAALGTFVELSAQTPQRQSTRPIRVVIDASHDGGAWWFPQGTQFDPRLPHQGSPLAEHLRGRGWEVVEVPRGTKIVNQLRGASIVVRLNLFGGYEDSEVAAYQSFVKSGGRLLLIEGYVRDGEANKDSVARLFGVRFEGVVNEPMIDRVVAGTFMQGIDLLGFQIGSIVVAYPKSTQPLAYLSKDRLVMGTFRYGRGRVTFLSSIYAVLLVPQPFTGRLFDELARSRPAKRQR
jgi:hypothetical protein